MIEGRDLLIYLAIVCKGNYDEIIRAMEARLFDPPPYEVNRVVSKLKCNVLTYLDPEFPRYLKYINSSPIVLFYYGDISLINDQNFKRNLAVVGTRNPTEYGIKMTQKLVYEVSYKANIVSGLAKGIDAVAHRSCIESEGKTIGVLGCGIDTVYPLENKKLYKDIVDHGGLIISEYPFDTEPHFSHFPFRNRLIAAFSRAVLVTEAYGYSGTSITVGFALEEGRDVMCIPYPIETKNDSFCNQLLFEGALFVRDGDDILSQLKLEE